MEKLRSTVKYIIRLQRLTTQFQLRT